MPNIFHQSVEDILKAATPEQRLLWNHIFLAFGDRVAISQYIYIGPVAGNQMINFVARRLYFAYEIVHQASNVTVNPAEVVTYYDENNANSGNYSYNRPIWDATAAAPTYVKGVIKNANTYFSRFIPGSYNFVKFIGYRITY